MHNDLSMTEPLATEASQFHGRPFLVIQAGEFADTLCNQIQDKRMRNLPEAIGSIDQFADFTDVLSNLALRCRMKAIYNDRGCKKSPVLIGEVKAWAFYTAIRSMAHGGSHRLGAE